VAIAVLAAVGFVIAFLPASMAQRFLPPDVQASGPSGTIWHGSFSTVSARGHQFGALEWRLHPLALLGGKLGASVRWAKQDFVVDADVETSGSSFAAHQVHGGGSLQSLADLGFTHGWNGTGTVAIEAFVLKDRKITAASGSVNFSGLKSAQFESADLGGVEVSFPADAVQADGTATAQVRDTGGPLQLQGTVSLAPAQSLATFTGAIKERGELPAALRQQLDNLMQMRGRDPQGRIPLDIEFSL
jgi:general secretion pathway protein N